MTGAIWRSVKPNDSLVFSKAICELTDADGDRLESTGD